MTRKDYILIAEALRYARGHAMAEPANTLTRNDLQAVGLRGVMASAEYIANACKNDNPRFDREHFLAVVRGERELISRPPRSPRKQDAGDHLWTSAEFIPGISNAFQNVQFDGKFLYFDTPRGLNNQTRKDDK